MSQKGGEYFQTLFCDCVTIVYIHCDIICFSYNIILKQYNNTKIYLWQMWQKGGEYSPPEKKKHSFAIAGQWIVLQQWLFLIFLLLVIFGD